MPSIDGKREGKTRIWVWRTAGITSNKYSLERKRKIGHPKTRWKDMCQWDNERYWMENGRRWTWNRKIISHTGDTKWREKTGIKRNTSVVNCINCLQWILPWEPQEITCNEHSLERLEKRPIDVIPPEGVQVGQFRELYVAHDRTQVSRFQYRVGLHEFLELSLD